MRTNVRAEADDARSPKRFGSRGATMVEYSLVVVFLVVGSLTAINYMNDEASDEVANQANCVSDRPPPPECQNEPIITTTTTDDPSTTVTTAPEPTEPPVTDPPPPPNTASWTGVSTDTGGGTWKASATIVVLKDDGSPAAGVRVLVSWTITDPALPEVFPGECITDAAGTCSVEYSPPYDSVAEVQGAVFRIESDPPVATPPGALVFTAP